MQQEPSDKVKKHLGDTSDTSQEVLSELESFSEEELAVVARVRDKLKGIGASDKEIAQIV
ncbi:MAG TPA: hypothetical protein VE688_08190 [Gaiellaceae bacterium]|nr:hypothetical protein [Gaiellaceae bacterium]